MNELYQNMKVFEIKSNEIEDFLKLEGKWTKIWNEVTPCLYISFNFTDNSGEFCSFCNILYFIVTHEMAVLNWILNTTLPNYCKIKPKDYCFIAS